MEGPSVTEPIRATWLKWCGVGLDLQQRAAPTIDAPRRGNDIPAMGRMLLALIPLAALLAPSAAPGQAPGPSFTTQIVTTVGGADSRPTWAR
jgi:hypothetical protein